MNATTSQSEPPVGSTPMARFISLRTKFALFFSLILIVSSLTFSWYFIQTRYESMMEDLQQVGMILVTGTVRNFQFWYGGVFGEDPAILEEFASSLMTTEEVVYLVVTGADGHILYQQSKLPRPGSTSIAATRDGLYPSAHLAKDALVTSARGTRVTRLSLSSDGVFSQHNESPMWVIPFFSQHNTLYDITMPIMAPVTPPSHSITPLESDDDTFTSPPQPRSRVIGLLQIGLTDAHAIQTLPLMIQKVLFLTLCIIVAGVLGTVFLISRITVPLRTLAAAAQRLTMRDHPPLPLIPASHDEVGQLTQHFSVMTQTLYERNQDITMNLETIRRQMRQLTTVHQASTAIAGTSTVDMDQLLDRVLQLLIENLGFSRMAIVLQAAGQHVATVAHIIGVRSDIAAMARQLEIPVIDDGSLNADLLIHGKPTLIHDIESVTHRIHLPVLDLMRRSRLQSFVAVPLQSHAKILGYLVGDRGTHPCTEDDLQILLTIAGHVAAAIDNAKAYSDLTELTQHLEEHIAQRTQELLQANAQLQEHDRNRLTFIAVASHELRTPLTVIRSFGDNMLDGVTGSLTDLQRTYLTRMKHNATRLGSIVDQLLDWSRLNRIALRFEMVCLQQITTLVIDNLMALASEKNVSLTLTPFDSLPLVHGDRNKLEQILWNLLGNAIKFTPPGGHVTIEFGMTPSGCVQTCVADTGCGIAPSHLAKIFTEFSGVPSAVPTSQGAQLGLWITKTLVTMHGGQIWIESQLGAGVRVYFTLPIEASQHEPRHTT